MIPQCSKQQQTAANSSTSLNSALFHLNHGSYEHAPARINISIICGLYWFISRGSQLRCVDKKCGHYVRIPIKTRRPRAALTRACNTFSCSLLLSPPLFLLLSPLFLPSPTESGSGGRAEHTRVHRWSSEIPSMGFKKGPLSSASCGRKCLFFPLLFSLCLSLSLSLSERTRE